MRRFLPLLAAFLASPAMAQTVQPVALGQPVTGTLSAEDPMLADQTFHDLWVFRGGPGTRVRILLTSEAFDTFLSVGALGAGGLDVSDTNDDYDPPGTNSRLDATVPAGGVLHIRVNSFDAGETGAYTLAVALAPNAPVGGLRPIAVATAAGAEFVDGETQTPPRGMPAHFWQCAAVAGERYAIALYSAKVDCFLSIGHGAGDEFESIEDNDDVDEGTDSRIIFEAPATGPVVIRASTFGAETGAYRLAIQRLPATRP